MSVAADSGKRSLTVTVAGRESRYRVLVSRVGAVPLHRRVLVASVAVAATAVVLFAVPLGFTVARLFRDQITSHLAADATRIAALVPERPAQAAHERLPAPRTRSAIAAVYDAVGRRVAGSGPLRSPIAHKALDGRLRIGKEGDALVACAPIPSDQTVAGAVRVAVPAARLRGEVRRAWALMAALAIVVLAVAAALARRQARRIARPLAALAADARRLGDGDFTVRATSSGVREVDAAAAALEDTAGRLDRLLERERRFTSEASHQLRTPLSGLMLGLERALDRPDEDLRPAVATALDRAEALNATVDELLALARGGGDTEAIDLAVALREAAGRWHPIATQQGRHIVLHADGDVGAAVATPTAVKHALDVLLDNAFRHGRGTVTLTSVDLGSGVALEVADEGPPIEDGVEQMFTARDGQPNTRGIGLALARRLVEADNGRLVLRQSQPHATFAILLRRAGD